MLPNFVTTTLDRLRRTADRIAFLGPTLARLTVGLVFIGTGWGKLHSIPDVTDFFTSLHIPAPGFNARLTAATEFFGGLAILFGLGTRLVALPLGFTMVIAILTAKREDITGLTALVGFEEWSYLVFFMWLALVGAGPVSVDGLIGKLRKRSDGCPPLEDHSASDAVTAIALAPKENVMTAALHLSRSNRSPPLEYLRSPRAAVVARAATVYLLVPWSVAVDPEAIEAAEVMGRYCRGDAAAFHRLYALLAPRLLAYLFGLLRDKAAAEDILQVTFLKVHEARSTYVMGANPIPWMYTIAHRTCLDELRKRKRNRVQLTKEGTLVTEPAADLTGVPIEASQDEAARPDAAAAAGALAALHQLPENQREALLLTKVHGRSTAEAAMIAGTTQGAIKQRAHRAYVTLRGLLGKEVAGAVPEKEPS